MSLFVGNISKFLSLRDLERQFGVYGKCKVDLRRKYAFIKFHNEDDAEDALKGLHCKELSGLRITVQWSKTSGRYEENPDDDRKKRERSRSTSRDKDKERKRSHDKSRKDKHHHRKRSPSTSSSSSSSRIVKHNKRKSSLKISEQDKASHKT